MGIVVRRRLFRLVGVSALVALLAPPASWASAAPAPGMGSGTTTVIPAQTTPPPTPPDDTSTPGPTTPPPGPRTTAPPTPGDTSTPGDTVTPRETPDSDLPSDPGEPGESVSDQLARQGEEIEDATADLNEEGEDVPEELEPAVRQLTATLKVAEDPKTSPQEREEVTETVQRVTSALAVIDDPETPAELRGHLIVIVQQVASALEGSLGPNVPLEVRASIISTAEQSTSALAMMWDSGAPRELREQMGLIQGRVTAALKASLEPQLHGLASQAGGVGRAAATIADPQTPQEQQMVLAEDTAQASSLLPRLGDPNGSRKERAKAEKAFRQQSAQMTKQQERAASAQGVPDVPLGEASEVCTNAVFAAVSDRALGWSLRDLLPTKWEIEGVQDFWKARAGQGDSLDVLAQLRNGEHADARFDVGQLTVRLAELVPARVLFGSIGAPALHCLQAAWHLDQQSGITAGTWLEMAREKKGDG